MPIGLQIYIELYKENYFLSWTTGNLTKQEWSHWVRSPTKIVEMVQIGC